MRTILTLDDDVAALIEEQRRKRRTTFKQIVNEALRAGLTNPLKRKGLKRSWTTPVHAGAFLIDVTSISEALEYGEGPWHK